jgi:fatty acid/phospholipid biosynthesis enzyme
MICHGSSTERSILNALRRAVEFHDRRINSQIIEALAETPAG